MRMIQNVITMVDNGQSNLYQKHILKFFQLAHDAIKGKYYFVSDHQQQRLYPVKARLCNSPRQRNCQNRVNTYVLITPVTTIFCGRIVVTIVSNESTEYGHLNINYQADSHVFMSITVVPIPALTYLRYKSIVWLRLSFVEYVVSSPITNGTD